MNKDSNLDELKEALDELATINRVLDRVCRVSETNHIMSVIIEELVRFTGAAQGVVNLVQAENADHLETVIRDTAADQEQEPYKVDDLISGWVLSNKQLLKIDDLHADQRFPHLSARAGGFKSLVCCPMVVRGEVIGLTTLVRDETAGPFSDGQCRVIGVIVSQTGQILSNAILLQELARKNRLLQLSQETLRDENLRLQSEVATTFAFENIVGKSGAMKQVLTLASKASGNDLPVLITGPTGTGKELIARAIHYNSSRRERPFVIKNCGVKTESLLESELFGHVKGAFTGADRSKPGLFKEADGGTVFLDEVGDAPLSTQVAILRALESGEIRPVGASRTEHVDVRVISATNRDLKKKISEGTFREDLFYRLNAFTIDMPPLDRRLDDIPLLTHHFINSIKIKLGYDRLTISPAALEALTRFPWPGNVRQLENELERAAVVCDTAGIIELHHLSREVAEFSIGAEGQAQSQGRLRRAVEKLEKELIIEVLAETSGNILKSSQILGLTRKGLKDKMARYGISPGDATDDQ